MISSTEPAAAVEPATTVPSKRTAIEQPAMNAEPALLVKKLSDKARLPQRGSAKAAGYDLCRYEVE